MDTRCPAMLQGPWRKLRAELYRQHLQRFYGRRVDNFHEVPGSGHDATAMFSSAIGLRFIFRKNLSYAESVSDCWTSDDCAATRVSWDDPVTFG